MVPVRDRAANSVIPRKIGGDTAVEHAGVRASTKVLPDYPGIIAVVVIETGSMIRRWRGGSTKYFWADVQCEVREWKDKRHWRSGELQSSLEKQTRMRLVSMDVD